MIAPDYRALESSTALTVLYATVRPRSLSAVLYTGYFTLLGCLGADYPEMPECSVWETVIKHLCVRDAQWGLTHLNRLVPRWLASDVLWWVGLLLPRISASLLACAV